MTNTSRKAPRFLGWLSLLLTVVVLALLLMGYRSQVGPFAIGALTCFALFCMSHRVLKSYAFTAWVFAFVAGSMFYPQAFMTWAGWDLGKLIVPLIQIIMFGMGTTLSVADFTRVLKMPWPVFIGMVLQFSIMPLAGFTVASLFGFRPEIAAGLILIGSCPGGVASNLMAYLAGGDVALSVTMTSCSTLMSPVMTPFMMKLLAGRLVDVKFVAMMLSIINMIIVPVLAGLVANRILYSRSPWASRKGPLALLTAAGFGAAVLTIVLQSILLALIARFEGSLVAALLGAVVASRDGIVIGSILIGAVALTKLIVSLVLGRSGNWMDRVLPVVSMAGICLIIAIITARSRQDLLTVGGLLIVAVVIHNSVGYILGYWLSRLVRLDERTCRTVAIEVGLQNGGMASALAMNVLKSAEAALAPAIFGPWMNVSGSVLATWWHRKPVRAVGVAVPELKTA
ncbi:MAG: bile acid:sodium symporter family protein [Planctomycetes bacterium]|nr:bile acid:sodium symporter family protein [Planctomycetota bacterium]